MKITNMILAITYLLALCLPGWSGAALQPIVVVAVPTPTITSFAPAKGVAGTVVTITGTNLNGITTVAFNGVPVKAFNGNSATSLIALVPEGATSGMITVTNASGTAKSGTDFIVPFGLTNNPIDGAFMVWVPGGTFTMGSAAGVGDKKERPAHHVTLSGYWIYQYDVTVAQYRAFCMATRHKLPEWPGEKMSWKGKTGWDDPALQQHPIVNVSWYDALAYADWAGVTLPTEAQWESAVRGPRGNNFPWGGTATKYDRFNGEDATKSANHDNSYKAGISTWPAGSFPADTSWCGAQDMAGNVTQWCGDWYGDYSATAVTNPTGPITGKERVTRGGWWFGGSNYGIGAYRNKANPNSYYNFIGFRCVSTAPGPFPDGTSTWVVPPTITTIAPTSAVAGTEITITGTYLDKVTTVTFNGIAAKTITDKTSSTLKVTVPEGATSGKLAITNAGGTVTSEDDFIVYLGLKTNVKDNAEMVWVPGATFTIGSAADVGYKRELPAHQVTLTGYWTYKYDVTVAQYRAFCAATGHALPYWAGDLPPSVDKYSWKSKIGWEDPELQQHPIVNVTWFDAKAYADWAGVTLPTEAQWEYAASGPKGNNYPWGGTAKKDDQINGEDETKCASIVNSLFAKKSTWPVGSFPAGASWCGAQDMMGNVWQWCGDWYGDYTATAVTDPAGPATGTYRVLRGSPWKDYSGRNALRCTIIPDDSNNGAGFRCVSLSPGP